MRTQLIDSSTGPGLLSDEVTSVSLADLASGTSLGCNLTELEGKSVLLACRRQLTAALALIELDGVAARVILCPPDLRADRLPFVIARGGVDTLVTDEEPGGELADDEYLKDIPRVFCHDTITATRMAPQDGTGAGQRTTEWVLLTSGTTGFPKLIAHTRSSLLGAIKVGTRRNSSQPVWGTFYDIRRYGGLQILLRALRGGGSLVLSSASEPVGDHLARLAACGVTHISGTPSQWRRALLSPNAHLIDPQYIRLSGEIADQGILSRLRSVYPNASISHAFASTEAGVAFEVTDGLAGFPSDFLGLHGDVEMKIEDGTLHIRSNRTALCYLDGNNGPLADAEGFVNTGDVVDRRGERCYFLGRKNGVINVGGLKVYPEEVEAVINRHPAVRMSRVVSRKSPVTGALVSASIVLVDSAKAALENGGGDIRPQLWEFCRQNLPAYKVPATIQCVAALQIASAGKLDRQYA